jgi:hypothetical protein
MGILNAPPKLKPGEMIRWQSFASRAASRWRTSGGKLFVTDQRVFFQPTRIDAVISGKPWECPLTAVTGVEIIDRDLTALAGGMRERLGIQTADGVEIFVVNKLENKVVELRELLGVT